MGKNSPKTKISWAKLLHAIQQNDMDAIHQHLTTSKRPKKINDLLLNACYQFNISKEMIELLIKHGANVNYETKYCESPLSITSNNGHFSLVRYLLDHGAKKESLGWSPLMFTLIYGTAAQCESALTEPDSDITYRDRLWQRTPLLLTIQSGNVEKVKLLLQAGASINETGRCEKRALTYAIQHDHLPMLEFLISQGANPDSLDENNVTHLMEAAEYNAINCLNYLLDHGADIHALDFVESTALDYCSDRNAITCLEKLIDAGADINRINGEGYNALMYAAESNHNFYLKQLIALGADPKITNMGESALHKAAYQNNIEAIEILLKAGADPNSQDVDDYTPLHASNSIEAATLLLKAGADKSAEDLCGSTPEKNSLCPKQVRKFIENWQG